MTQGPIKSNVAQASASAPGSGAQGLGLQPCVAGLRVSALGPSESNPGPACGLPGASDPCLRTTALKDLLNDTALV